MSRHPIVPVVLILATGFWWFMLPQSAMPALTTILVVGAAVTGVDLALQRLQMLRQQGQQPRSQQRLPREAVLAGQR